MHTSTNLDQWVFRLAGLFILVSTGLSVIHSQHWLWISGFVGLNMLQTSFTGFCPLVLILKKFGVPAGPAFCNTH